MVDSTTTNYGWTKPVVGADSDIWGGLLNTDLDSVDAIMAGLAKTTYMVPVLSTAGSSASFAVAACAVVDTATLYPMVLGPSLTKTTGSWAVGSGSGGLDTGAIANSTWYHAYLIRRPDTGVVDAIISTNASAPSLPSGYTQYSFVESMLTDGSGHWVKFNHDGRRMLWDVPSFDVAAGPIGTSPGDIGVAVPPGRRVYAIVSATVANASEAVGMVLYDPSTTGAAATAGNYTQTSVAAGVQSGGQCSIRTSLTQTIKGVASQATSSFYLATQGWEKIG